MKFNKEIKEIFRREKARFLANQRFSRIFSDIELGHVFANNANLKKLIVRTKIGRKNQKVKELEIVFSLTMHARRMISILLETQVISNK